MATEETTKQVLALVATAYGKNVADITVDTTFDELGGGSMKMIALTSTLENELDVEVTIHEVMKMSTVGELVERVEEEL
ncbi:MAG: acyl carrier protein [Atopobium sp.]|uniref:acyl carrier protein n=1 Tax=Atopobium sp. TaxID=1872650 RepID=UPI002A75B411|nr:acyl carrier protein [Atopobium sp.]MDY2789080.1 acyl carrier protein [Atopobium sp.]